MSIRVRRRLEVVMNKNGFVSSGAETSLARHVTLHAPVMVQGEGISGFLNHTKYCRRYRFQHQGGGYRCHYDATTLGCLHKLRSWLLIRRHVGIAKSSVLRGDDKQKRHGQARDEYSTWSVSNIFTMANNPSQISIAMSQLYAVVRAMTSRLVLQIPWPSPHTA